MERCPTCNARYTGKRVCHRCKADLGPLADIEQDANSHLEKAISAFFSEDYDQMFFHARRSFSLRQTRASARVLACASVLVRRFDIALSLWKWQNQQ
ncbi:MAG: hypothetical protein GY795_14785 [Desulfobacterales bacterium]|nr:hypothetical protein [Desulfobacterales bacterium]